MKRRVFTTLAAALLISACALAQNSLTPNLKLNVPTPGSSGWAPRINANMTRIDCFLSGGCTLPSLAIGPGFSITMDAGYVPSTAHQLATKAYVDGLFSTGTNATSINGIPVSGSPTNQQALLYNGTNLGFATLSNVAYAGGVLDPSLVQTQYTAGTGGVSAGQTVQVTSTTASVAAVNAFGGVAINSAAIGGNVWVATIPGAVVPVYFDAAAVVGDIAIPSTTAVGELHDSGQTSSANITIGTIIVGKILSTVSGPGVQGNVRLHGLGIYGQSGVALLATSAQQSFTGNLLMPELLTSSRPYADVRTYGALCNGGDDHTAFNNAITAMHRSTVNCGLGSTPPTASCTGVVFVPNTACFASQIVMQNNVKLKGTGPTNTVLVQSAGANEHFIVGTTPATDQRFTLEDLYLNGNKSNQTGTWDCVNFNSTGSLAGSTRSPRHTIQNVWAANCGEDGFDIWGDAGSNYLLNVKGLNNGRYGMTLDTYDSHLDVGEFASNGTAGVYLGTHGNGSVASVKSWGNGGSGTAVGNAGFIMNSGNWRLVNDEAQDNSCNGFYFLSVSDTSGDGLLADGNGPTGGGSGCAGYVFSGSTKNKITGVFRGVTDAGWSDYAINWIGGNSNNDVSLVVDNPKIGNYLGTLSNNNFHSDTLDVSSAAHTMNNGAVQRGYSDNQSTQTYSLDASTGIANYKNNQVSAAGNSIYSCGGPNNFDFANTSLLGLFYGSGVYAYTEGSTGSCVTGVPIPLLYNPPVRFGAGVSDNIGTTIASATTIAPPTPGVFHITGTTTITTITPPVNCATAAFACRLTLIFDGLAPMATGGNIATGCTPAPSQELQLHYDPTTTLWYGTGCAVVSTTPRMNFSGSSGTSFASLNNNYGGSYTPSAAIKITGFDLHLDTSATGCTTWPVISVYDETAGSAVSGTGITLAASTVNFHITASATVAAGHTLAFATTTAAVGCSPTSPHFNVEYVMQ